MDEIKQENLKANPEQRANPISKLFFCFITPLLRLGYRKTLETSDLYQVLDEDESKSLCAKLDKAWENEQQLSKEKNIPARLHNAIYSVFGWKYSLLGLILIFEEFIKILQPVFMGRLIRYFRFCSTTSLNEAYFYAFNFSMCAVLLAIWHHPYFYHVQRIGMQIRIAVSGLIYKKILRVSTNSLREIEAGKIVNMLSNDVARFDQTVIFLHYFWAAPLSLIGFIALLWYEMGPSCLAGFGCLILLVPIQGFMGRKMGLYRRQVAKISDQRIGVMNELLNAIRVIKMYAWEKPFAQIVDSIRKREIGVLRMQAMIQGLLIGLFFVTGKIIILCALVAYFLTGAPIGAEMVFVASALFNTVRLTLTLFLPFAIQFYTEYKVTTSRIEKFLSLSDHVSNVKENVSCVNGKKKDDNNKNVQESCVDSEMVAVHLADYSAKWGAETTVLKDINLHVKAGQLVMIVGPVGAGKSSMLHSLCGEAESVSGSVTINGKVVYVPQEAWIFSASVRQNIIFGRQTFEPERYDQALTVCQMQQDVASFSHGDATVVGDKGAALSGGQKARINLARAIYFDADIYLLDDPLSAVDAAVGRLLFENCILQHLSKKIRILVTHQLQYLKYADLIVVMKDGSIAASGSFNELERLGDEFTSIMRETEESYKQRKSALKSLSSDLSLTPDSYNRTLSLTNIPSAETSSGTTLTKHQKNGAENNDLSQDDTLNEARQETKALIQPKLVRQHSEWKRDVLSQVEDEKSAGLVNWRVYLTYFRNMGHVCCVVLLFIFCIFVQVLFNFSDYWLNIWATAEDVKRVKIQYPDRNAFYNNTEMCPNLNATLQTVNSRVDPVWRQSMTSQNYLIIYAVIIGILTLSSLIRSAAFRIMLSHSSFVLHSGMFRAVLNAPTLFFDRNPVGRILNRFSKDTGTMDELLSYVTFDFVQGIITFLGIILMVGIMNPLIFIPIIPLICLFLYARTYYMRTARVIKRLEATTKSPVYSHVSATLQGLTSIRSFGAQNHVMQDFHRHQNTHTSVYSAFLSTGRWFSLIIDWLCSVFVTVVAFLSVWSSEEGQAGEVGLNVFYASTLMILFSRFLQQSVNFEASMVSVERIMEYCGLEPEDDSKAKIIPNKAWPIEGCIEFKNVQLRYSDESSYVLHDFCCKIEAKEKIGIVGRTGAGKSSILNSIFRLSKIGGKIIIDGIDTQTVDLHELRRRISIIPQDPMLFIGSLRKNLDPFDEYNDDAIWNALDLVELKSVFKEYEHGLESQMQEGGANVSVGQRQLVCLARALLRQNKILVIDEATANVDLHTDFLIQKTIRRQFKECTVLTIAHRLNTIMDSDRIIVMDKGRLTEIGQPLKLLRDGGALYRLVEETGSQNAAALMELARKAAEEQK